MGRKAGTDTNSLSRHELLGRDHVDQVLADWTRERPDLDTTPVAIVGRLGRLCVLLDAGLEATFRRYGLSRAGFDVLATLRRTGAPYRLPQKELMHTLLRASGTVSFRIDRLAGQGLVRREQDPDDRRNVFVALTEEGLRLVDLVVPAHLANEEHLLSCLNIDERAALAALLRTLLLSFEAPPDKERFIGE